MTVTEPGPKRLSGEGDGRDGGTVKYVVRAKALDDTGKPTPFSILDPTTVLRCSLRLGDSHSVHSNGCLHGLGRRKNAGADGGDDLQNNKLNYVTSCIIIRLRCTAQI